MTGNCDKLGDSAVNLIVCATDGDAGNLNIGIFNHVLGNNLCVGTNAEVV